MKNSTTEKETKTRWLHIPMEIIGRELYPKLLLAVEANKNGWSCTIGSKRALIDSAHIIPPGIIYLKSVIPSEYENIITFKNNGHRLVSLDEEGLIQTSLETLVTARFCDKTVAEVEKFFCWGDIQQKALQERYSEHAKKFITTGSPTADLWIRQAQTVHKESVDKIKKQFGRYILIPSSFGVPNHFMGKDGFLGIMQRDNMFKSEENRTHYIKYNNYAEKVFHKFLELLPLIAREFEDYTIILRPHPSENHDIWKEAAKGLTNVEVLFEGSVSPWLLGAEAILHWGSTTGVEAHLLGKAVIAYIPYPEEDKEYNLLPHSVSITTHTVEDAFEALYDVLGNPANWQANYPDVKKGHKELKNWLFNIDHAPATENIMHELNKMNLMPQKFDTSVKIKKASNNIRLKKTKEIIWHILATADKIPNINRYFPERIKLGIKSREYGRHKTKNICEQEIKYALKQLSNAPISAKKLANNLFCITDKQP